MNILFLLLAIALFIALVLKNVPIVIATILSSIFLLLTQQMDLYDGITATYMTGFGDYVRDFFLLFMLGALFGKLVEISGAANSISTFIFRAFGDRFAIIGLIIMGIILTLGDDDRALHTVYPERDTHCLSWHHSGRRRCSGHDLYCVEAGVLHCLCDVGRQTGQESRGTL